MVARCVAHDAIDVSAHSPAGIVSVECCTDPRVVGQFRGRDSDLLPKNFGEGPNFLPDVIEDLHLDIVTHFVGQPDEGQLLSNF